MAATVGEGLLLAIDCRLQNRRVAGKAADAFKERVAADDVGNAVLVLDRSSQQPPPQLRMATSGETARIEELLLRVATRRVA